MSYGSNPRVFDGAKVRYNAILPYRSAEDLSSSIGAAVKILPNGYVAKTTGAAADLPFGVVLNGVAPGADNSIAIMANGFTGTANCSVKEAAAATGDYLYTNNTTGNGVFTNEANSEPTDTLRYKCGQAMESSPSGATGSYNVIEGVIFAPIKQLLQNAIEYNGGLLLYNGLRISYNSH
tara:strand:- start:13501 stop:14037 length:537 start_codon:yes stop_codon:yes gene_type:complete